MKPNKVNDLLDQAVDITHLVGANNYTWINRHRTKPQLFSKPLLYYERQLPAFIRAHKTVLINPAYIKRLLPPPRPKMAASLETIQGEWFPISRRRWTRVAQAFASYQAANGEPTRSSKVTRAIRTAAPLLLITDESTGQVAELLTAQWPLVPFRTMGHCPDLTRQLLSLSPEAYPALLVVDDRAGLLVQTQALAQLKSHPQLSRIPIILFVSPRVSRVMAGYQEPVNSVICLEDNLAQLVIAIERICRYWFGLAALPSRAL